MKKLLVIAIALFGFSAVSFGQNTEATALTSATILRPIDISKVTDLNFGQILSSSAAGTVTISTDNQRTFTDGASGSTSGTFSNTPSYATFTVAGTANSTFSISQPASFDITNTTAGDVSKMTVSNIKIAVTSGGLNATQGTIDPTSGTRTLFVGATLAVKADQPAGLYTNSDALTITVNYN